MTEQHRYVDADAEKLTDSEFVQHVVHPAHPTHGDDAGPAGETPGEPDVPAADEPRQ